MIYIIEGPDGTGKTTLAKAIETAKEGTIFHAGQHRADDMARYHGKLFNTAFELDLAGIPVVLDRWAPSEYVYGKVFRGGQAYDTDVLMKMVLPHAVLIYCRNEDAAINHRRNTEARSEYVADISQVVATYERYVGARADWGWLEYDFDKVNIDDFVGELP